MNISSKTAIALCCCYVFAVVAVAAIWKPSDHKWLWQHEQSQSITIVGIDPVTPATQPVIEAGINDDCGHAATTQPSN